MRFYTTQHPFYGGIDLHARRMDVCLLSQDGASLVHRTMQAAPEPFLKAIAPYRDRRVGAVECLFTWYGLADLCPHEGMPFVLGQALSMQAIHGGTAKNDQMDAHKMAVLLRGGMRPQASVSPAARRATRALWRRRMPLRRTRAELLAHVHNTTSHYTLPESGKQSADTANRDGVAARLPDPAVPKRIEVALALLDDSDQRLPALQLPIVHTAQAHAANPLYRLLSMPGVGNILALVMRYAIHAIQRCPRVQDCVS